MKLAEGNVHMLSCVIILRDWPGHGKKPGVSIILQDGPCHLHLICMMPGCRVVPLYSRSFLMYCSSHYSHEQKALFSVLWHLRSFGAVVQCLCSWSVEGKQNKTNEVRSCWDTQASVLSQGSESVI